MKHGKTVIVNTKNSCQHGMKKSGTCPSLSGCLIFIISSRFAILKNLNEADVDWSTSPKPKETYFAPSGTTCTSHDRVSINCFVARWWYHCQTKCLRSVQIIAIFRKKNCFREIKPEMRDVIATLRECEKEAKIRDIPHDYGMVDT